MPWGSSFISKLAVEVGVTTGGGGGGGSENLFLANSFSVSLLEGVFFLVQSSYYRW